MASVNKSRHSPAKSNWVFSLNFAIGGLVACGVIAGTAWGLASSLSAMHEASRTLSEATLLGVPVADAKRPELSPKAVKSARFLKLPESDVRGLALTGEAVRVAHQRVVATRLALAEKREKAENTRILAAFSRAVNTVEPQAPAAGNPTMLTALVEDVPVKDMQPFDLVLVEPEADEELALPDQIPLPEARPLTEAVATDPKPPVEKPAPRRTDDGKDLAYAKPERSIFGNLFNRKSGDGAWPGHGTRVAIYDVSNATVHMPDGTKLRAHSGIGRMRDNPRYEHVKMNGPTPAGIYRLSMREKRFYGVEAIRMTSIDGRDPKNRTGLLTHTNLLRGQIGSHGCVAFQNYEPFLNAFKRGKVNMMIVVPELPSSRNHLAALYRKAGA
jgi:hypothetical protein